MITQRQALENATKLCNKLGKGWEPRVWENLGWCYSAKKDKIQVHESTLKKSYSAYFTPNSIVVGESDVSPQEAVKDLESKYRKAYEERLFYWQELQNSL